MQKPCASGQLRVQVQVAVEPFATVYVTTMSTAITDDAQDFLEDNYCDIIYNIVTNLKAEEEFRGNAEGFAYSCTVPYNSCAHPLPAME